MRYFSGPSELFDALRGQIMAMLQLPSGTADEPWAEGVTTLALAPHEYEPPHYQSLIDYALANGAQEISEEAYFASSPSSNEP